MVKHEPGNVARHNQFESLDRVVGLSGPSHEDGQCRSKASHPHEHRLRAHALDREADPGQVEVTVQDFATHHLEKKTHAVMQAC